MNYDYENNLISQGYTDICGIDEAGRGSYAGPLVAGSVILDPDENELVEFLADSKLLTAKRREQVLPMIMCKAKAWSVGLVTNEEIDLHGLGFANKIAMKRAWKHLRVTPNYILSDYMPNLSFATPFELIKSGDRKIATIAAASIVAKVFRDRMMVAFHNKYPEYEFAVHKGYGTQMHRDKLDEFGPCDLHRKSFAPIKAKLF